MVVTSAGQLVVASLLAVLQADGPASSLRCHGSTRSSLTLGRDAEQRISAAVRRVSRCPVVDIQRPEPDQEAPVGAVEALTLTWGSCDGGEGDRFLVHRGRDGWRVLKKVGHWASAP